MIIIKRFISFVLALVLVFAFSISSFASITADIQADDLASGWGSGSSLSYPTGYLTSWYYRVLYWLSQIRSDSSSILFSLGSKTSSQSNIITCLNSIMSHTSGTIGEFYYEVPFSHEFKASSDFFASVGSNLFNIFDELRAISGFVADFSDQMTKAATRNTQDIFTENFLESSSSNSVKTDDIVNLSSVSTSFKDTFSTGSSSSGVFDVLNSNNPWEWFTSDVANSLLADSSFSVSTFSLRSSPFDNVEVVTSYYEDNLSDFYSWLDMVGVS